jgi:hypothetical protein
MATTGHERSLLRRGVDNADNAAQSTDGGRELAAR